MNNAFPLGRLLRLLLGTLGVVLGLIVALLIRDAGQPPPALRPQPVGASPAAPPPVITSLEEQAIRAKAWTQVGPLLAAAEKAGSAALDGHLATIPAFLAERHQGTPAFAARLLGLAGKWELIKSRCRAPGNEEYARWLQEQFAEYVLRGDDLQQVVAAAVRAYVSELQGIENQLLLRLQADLSDGDLPAASVIPALRSEAILRQHYDALLTQMLPLLQQDLKLTAGREVASFVAGELATVITVRVGTAVLSRLGVATGILTAGAASGWATFGVGVVAGILVDQVIDRIIKAAGYDAEERIAARVNETLDAIGRAITDGDPEAKATVASLERLQYEDPDPRVRGTCAQAIRRIQSGCRLHGLRGELNKVNAARAALRKLALDRLIRNEETVPCEP